MTIQASARPNGDTHRAVKELSKTLADEYVDLLDYQIHPFRYDQNYPPDDQFLDLITEMILPAEQLIFVTPIYWYTMSAQLKQFFDRCSDLLITHKELGRQLRGKSFTAVSVGNVPKAPEHFYEPFKLTAAYLGMAYVRSGHAAVEGETVEMTWL